MGRRTLPGLVLAAGLCLSGCSASSPSSPSGGSGTLAIVPATDFLLIGASVTFEARLTEGTAAARVVAAEWSSDDGRVAAVDRQGRVSALASGVTTIRAVFEGRAATQSIRVAPNAAGTWTGARRVTACLHPTPAVCATTYPVGRQFDTRLVLMQTRAAVTGVLNLSPPAASPSAALSGEISMGGLITLTGPITRPGTGPATISLGTIADWRTEVDAVQPILRGSFAEVRTDADGTSWRVSWEFVGLTRN